MRNYSYVTALAVVFVMALSATAFANGVVIEETVIVPAPVVQPAPPVGAGVVTPVPTIPAAPATPVTEPAQRCFTMDQLVTLTVAESWELSGRNTDAWGDIIQAMADYSASTRGLNIPNTRQSGMWIGQLVKQQAQCDPNKLLYSVVDNAVVQYANTFGIRSMAG